MEREKSKINLFKISRECHGLGLFKLVFGEKMFETAQIDFANFTKFNFN